MTHPTPPTAAAAAPATASPAAPTTRTAADAPGVRLLRRTLLANAAFSTASGLTLIVASPWLAPRLGPPALALAIVGVLLLPFAWEVARAGRRPTLRRGEIRTIIALDAGWVVLSAVALLAGWLPLTVPGVGAVIGIAEVVAAFAVLQAIGLRRGGAR